MVSLQLSGQPSDACGAVPALGVQAPETGGAKN